MIAPFFCIRMQGQNSTVLEFSCAPSLAGNFAIALMIFALPFHCLVMKILSINLEFQCPRHIILFCLSLSDCLQVLVTSIVIIVLKVDSIGIGCASCNGLRLALIFNATLTYLVSSLTLVALSIERYIACFHSYRIHELLTNRRTMTTLVLFWLLGSIFGGIALVPHREADHQALLTNSAYFGTITVVITPLVSLILIVIQSLLYCLSRKKMARVLPATLSSTKSEMDATRRQQMKVAFVASMVVLSYLVCMLPGACVIIINRFANVGTATNTKKMLTISLGMLNTLLNPFIYGLGMLDTRKAIEKELKKIKNWLLAKLGTRDEIGR